MLFDDAQSYTAFRSSCSLSQSATFSYTSVIQQYNDNMYYIISYNALKIGRPLLFNNKF